MSSVKMFGTVSFFFPILVCVCVSVYMEVFVHVETSLSLVNHLILLSLYSLRLSSLFQLVWLVTKLQRKLPVVSVQSWNYAAAFTSLHG